MNPKDLLDIELMQKVNNQFKPRAMKLRFEQATRTLHPRLGKQYWREHFRAVRKNKKKLERLMKERPKKERAYESRCPTRYEPYIRSKWWVERKNRFYQQFGRKCEICGSSTHIQLHHKYYGRFGQEKNTDLVALCAHHHRQFHETVGRTKTNMRKVTDDFILKIKTQLQRKA